MQNIISIRKVFDRIIIGIFTTAFLLQGCGGTAPASTLDVQGETDKGKDANSGQEKEVDLEKLAQGDIRLNASVN